MPRRTCCLKPDNSAVTSYAPTGRAGLRELPVSLVIIVRVSPLSVCFAVTLTPGTSPPPASRTTPDMVAENSCPNRPVANAITPRIPINSVTDLLKFFLLILPIIPLHFLQTLKVRSYCSSKNAASNPARSAMALKGNSGKELVFLCQSKATPVCRTRQEIRCVFCRGGLSRCEQIGRILKRSIPLL